MLVLDAVPVDLDILNALPKKVWDFEKTTFDFEALKPVSSE
jgi:hypothetical protein